MQSIVPTARSDLIPGVLLLPSEEWPAPHEGEAVQTKEGPGSSLCQWGGGRAHTHSHLHHQQSSVRSTPPPPPVPHARPHHTAGCLPGLGASGGHSTGAAPAMDHCDVSHICVGPEEDWQTSSIHHLQSWIVWQTDSSKKDKIPQHFNNTFGAARFSFPSRPGPSTHHSPLMRSKAAHNVHKLKYCWYSKRRIKNYLSQKMSRLVNQFYYKYTDVGDLASGTPRESEVYLPARSPKLAEHWVAFMDCTTGLDVS